MPNPLLSEIFTVLNIPSDKHLSMLQELDELIWNEAALLFSEKLPESERQKIEQAFKESKKPEEALSVHWSPEEIQATVLEATRTILKDYLETMTANITDDQREKITAAIAKYKPAQ